jgi:hypothetical protein
MAVMMVGVSGIGRGERQSAVCMREGVNGVLIWRSTALMNT